MQQAGQKLRRARERLGLRYRDVERASLRIGSEKGNQEFVVGLSRLADIENKGTVPSIYRLYSLCAIYGLDFTSVLAWYGIELPGLASDAARVRHEHTHPIDLKPSSNVTMDFPMEFDGELDLRHTSYLSRQFRRWGRLPIAMLSGTDLARYRYGFIGTEDWSMYPMLRPGSFIQIDETRRKATAAAWADQYERPIYFVEHRDGYCCGWCEQHPGLLIVQPHSSSAGLRIFRSPGDAEIIGQVIAVVMRLDLAKRRHIRS